MGCKDLGPPLLIKDFKMPKLEIEKAGIMVGIDLTKPIDLSQMNVWHISFNPVYSNNHFEQIFIERECLLQTIVINDDGDREELEITIKLKSQQMPKIV